MAPARQSAGQPQLFDKPLPPWTPPALAKIVDNIPVGNDWSHEIKWDGYRLCCHVDGGHVTIHTRRGHDWTARFPSIATGLAKLPVRNAVIDGEAVILDDAGASHFDDLQAALGRGSAGKAATAAILVAFDLMFLDGADLRASTLKDRRETLATLVPKARPHLRFSEDVEGDPRRILEAACDHGLEGVISKRRSSPYRSGRTGDWVKTKCVQSDTFVIIGYEPSTAGYGVGGLRVAEKGEGGKLVSVGGVGTGYTREVAAALKKRLDMLKTPPKPPIAGLRSKTVVWVRPELSAEVAYRARTRDGELRHASFKGLRDPANL